MSAPAPVPGPPAGPAGGPPGPPAPAEPVTLVEKMQIDANDPFEGEYGAMYASFAIEGPSAVTAGDILQATLDDDSNRVYLGFDEVQGEPSRSFCLSLVQKVPVPVGRRGSEHAGKIVALYEDVHDMGGTYVEFPRNAFHAFTDSVRVPTMAAIDAVVAGMVDGAHYLGPYPDAGAPDTELIRVRVYIWVPPALKRSSMLALTLIALA